MGIEEILSARRHEVLRIAAKYGAHNVRVFGSVARGEATDESDVDLLVSFEPGRTLLDHAGLQIELEKILGRRVEVASERGLNAHLREHVLSEATAL